MECGVYAIIHRESRKIYIGSSVSLARRLNRYSWDLKSGNESERPINAAIAKEPEQFEFSVIELTATKEEALDREQFWIHFYRSHLPEFGYNACPNSRNLKGYKQRPESIARKVAASIGRKHSHPRTPEQCLRMSLARKGTHQSPETIAKQVATRSANKVGWRKVEQIDSLGNVIATFDRITDAEKILGCSNISAVCSGKRPLALGYKWRYA